MTVFVERERELLKLKDLEQKRQADVVVIRGRRRVGKSRLAAALIIDKI